MKFIFHVRYFENIAGRDGLNIFTAFINLLHRLLQ